MDLTLIQLFKYIVIKNCSVEGEEINLRENK